MGSHVLGTRGKKLKFEIKEENKWKAGIKDEILVESQIKFEFSESEGSRLRKTILMRRKIKLKRGNTQN